MALAGCLSCACADDKSKAIPADGGMDGGTDGATDGGVEGGALAPLDPHVIPQFEDPLVVPPAMPPERTSFGVTEYEIAARQFQQQILPKGMPETTVWGYGRASDPSTFHTPSFTFEVRTRQTVHVKWINGLVDPSGHHLKHLLPVDPTLHWANPAGPPDSHGMGLSYEGPVPIVTHVHGGHVQSGSDGNPEAWYLPAATDIPSSYSTRGTYYGSVTEVGNGAALFEYPNDVRASTLWYHDHALGITRLNVYAGLAGFWILRDQEEDDLRLPGPAPQIGDAAGTRYYEIPIAIQDRSFHVDGSLAYPAHRSDFDGYTGPFDPETSVHPIWNPEVFGTVMVVNGRAWPYLDVEPRLYRFRLLNGCNARTLRLKFNREIDFHRIGAEGGLLSGAPVAQHEILMMPGERADVIVDFRAFPPGDVFTLINTGPDEPYQGPKAVQEPADPSTTGRVLQLHVVAATGAGTSGTIPSTLPPVTPLETTLAPRDLTLNEQVYLPDDIPVEAQLGTAKDGPLEWDSVTTEKPTMGDTEIWRLINLTADAHPIHLHLVMFRVLDRTPFDAEAYQAAQRSFLSGAGVQPRVEDYVTAPPVPANPWESGLKDTVIANPGEVTRIISNFDIAGRYVWHCHILEHEDNEMMRTYEVLPRP